MDESFEMLRQVARNELIHILEVAPGAKDMVIDECIMKPLDRVASLSLLRQHGVDKIFRFERGKAIGWGNPEQTHHRLYLVRPSLPTCKCIVEQIKSENRYHYGAAAKKEYTVVFFPRKFSACERVFEENGIYGQQVTFSEFNPGFIPFESSLLTLELPEFFPSFYLDNTYDWIHSAAYALWNLQNLYGLIPRVYSLGHASHAVFTMLKNLNYELGEPKPTPDQHISHLFIMDRSIDLMTMFLSCVTYEALLDETFAIKSGTIDFGPEITKAEKGTKFVVNNQDDVFNAIRDRHFSHVFSFLSERAKAVQAGYDKRHQAEGVSELKHFVANELKDLKAQHKSLQLHIAASEMVVNAKSKAGFQELLACEQNILAGIDHKRTIALIEDLMAQQLPDTSVLSLMAIFSIGFNGLSSKDYQSLRTQYLHAYGFKHLYTFHQLKRAQILFERDRSTATLSGPLGTAQISLPSSPGHHNTSSSSSSNQGSSGLPSFQALCRKLNLMPHASSSQPVNLKDPSDPSYLYNGAYTPAIPAIIQSALQFGFNKEDLSRTFQCPINVSDSHAFPAGKPVETRIRRSVLVYFLGGVTRAELAALRLIERLRSVKIIVATTNIIRKDDFFKTLSEW